MEYAFLGGSGLTVSRLGFGGATFGGTAKYYAHIGTTGVEEATRIVGRCIDAGVTLFDTSNSYSDGDSELILGKALGARRKDVVLASKVSVRVGGGPNDVGLSRHNIVQSCEDSLKRLGTTWLDLYQMHVPDTLTPIEETLRALDDLVRTGKVRYVGVSNYSGWQLMKSLAVSDARQLERFISQQVYYSLVARDVEHELVPLSIDQKVGMLIWGPLASGFLSGKLKRGEEPPKSIRMGAMPGTPKVGEWDRAHDILDVARKIAEIRGVSVGQVAMNWLLAKPWVTSVLIGARNEAQLEDNLGSASWRLSPEEVAELDAISAPPFPYPYWTQRGHAERNPALTNTSALPRLASPEKS
ncbi:aldo/keto reductase [Terricaulis silvestris]|uniref:General stress protein 69 n=1 Tax=Terricaulis silvestris TaxID=2686094 RepID=A0A6I6MR92_9CAUL|nr:aldo/keto reductase [Terricaulis silvestris]QGZ93653.1 General stress protein 69 [Terricaulis silvestris]